MPKGYIIGHIEVTDPESYKAYQAKVPGIIAAHGGTYLVRGGDGETLEGEIPGSRSVVLEFPSVEQAKKFYFSTDYAEVIGIRQSASKGTLVLVSGVDGQPE